MIKTWTERYERHPDHQTGVVMSTMVKARMQEEIDDLRAALAQTEKEPVGWMYSDDHERMLRTETFCTIFSVKVGSPDKGVTDVPLYTAPPQRQPLTDKQIAQCLEATEAKWSDAGAPPGGYARLLISAIEAAHGIQT